MIETVDPVDDSGSGTYRVVETGALVSISFDLNPAGNVINDTYELWGHTVTPSEEGWTCDCGATEPNSQSVSNSPCNHIREAKKVENVVFRGPRD